MRRWQIFSAVALRKNPEILPKQNAIHAKVQSIFDAWEVANSKLSNHELQDLADIEARDKPDTDVVIKETAQDRLDAWVAEKSKFVPADHDERLSKFQYLFLKQKFGSDIKDQWLLPQAAYDSKVDVTLMDTARRALKDSLNIVNGYVILGKVPSSVYSFRYPKKMAQATGFIGAKVFFLKAHLDLPSKTVLKAIESPNQDKLRWLTRDEAYQNVHKNYIASFSKGLVVD